MPIADWAKPLTRNHSVFAYVMNCGVAPTGNWQSAIGNRKCCDEFTNETLSWLSPVRRCAVLAWRMECVAIARDG